ncbi:hypothetical protein GCM10027589_27390 [Actinocorallia lasiicapitis]
MTLLNDPRTSLHLDSDPVELVWATRKANHDTSLASWAVCVMGVATLLQLPSLAALTSGPRTLLALLLLPLLLGGYQSVQYLHRASAGVDAAVTVPQLMAGLETRRYWAYRAQNWALVSAFGFGLWTLAVQFLA